MKAKTFTVAQHNKLQTIGGDAAISDAGKEAAAYAAADLLVNSFNLTEQTSLPNKDWLAARGFLEIGYTKAYDTKLKTLKLGEFERDGVTGDEAQAKFEKQRSNAMNKFASRIRDVLLSMYGVEIAAATSKAATGKAAQRSKKAEEQPKLHKEVASRLPKTGATEDDVLAAALEIAKGEGLTGAKATKRAGVIQAAHDAEVKAVQRAKASKHKDELASHARYVSAVVKQLVDEGKLGQLQKLVATCKAFKLS
jgi:hypothetical protein